MNNKIKKIILLLLLMTCFYFFLKNGRALSDQYAIWLNPPSDAVIHLATITDMTNEGRRIFYASIPSINDAADFNSHCSEIETTMIILGCYSGGRIYVFNVRDERIADAKYVASAHEMLHAAYARLSGREREKVNGLLEAAYLKAGASSDFRDIMAEYAKVEPGQRDNELHSVLGTEYAELSPALEDYYSRYFVNRTAIVDMAVRYKEVFKNLESDQVRLKSEMDNLTARINSDSSLYDTLLSHLNTDIDSFNAEKFRSQAEFYAQRQALTQRGAEIDRFQMQIRVDIDRYNALVEKYNSLGGKLNQLARQLDSKAQAGIRTIGGTSAP